MTDPLLSDARALAHRLGLIEPGPHGENVLKESAVRAIQAFALRQRAEGAVSACIVAGTMAERPYDAEPEFSVVLAVEQAIREFASRLEAQAKEIEG